MISGVCVSAHDTAATWMMNTLTSSRFLISVMSTVASLPLFFFTLPAGSLADLVDRKKLLCTMNLWLAFSAGIAGRARSARLAESIRHFGVCFSDRRRIRLQCPCLECA